jgi:hypothetical protein
MTRTLYSDDCLNVLNDEMALPTGSVDLIYLDPPFNSKSIYNLPFRSADIDARPVEAFTDTWTWGIEEERLLTELTHFETALADIVNFARRLAPTSARSGPDYSLAAYLVNMAIRLLAMRRVLSGHGSIYLHCDDTANHYLKLLLDAIFGQENYRAEISGSVPAPTTTPDRAAGNLGGSTTLSCSTRKATNGRGTLFTLLTTGNMWSRTISMSKRGRGDITPWTT